MKLRISENIHRFRKEMGLTQEQLAEAMNVSVGAVSKWETGQSNPDISLIAELADFFQISVDVLLGYNLNSTTAAEAAEKIKRYKLNKDFGQARIEAGKALQRYPNVFDVVYQSAGLYYICGMENDDSTASNKALELFNTALLLLQQNTDDKITETSIRTDIGCIYAALGKQEQAIEYLKKYNPGGINNGRIGELLSRIKKYDEAMPYLSDSLLSGIISLSNTVLGLGNIYANKKDYKSVLEIYEWICCVLSSLRGGERITCFDKLEAVLTAACAYALSELNDYDGARRKLIMSREIALRFDSKPDYSTESVKFYHGEYRTTSDDIGETAIDGIEHLLEDEEISPKLMKLWREINDGN